MEIDVDIDNKGKVPPCSPNGGCEVITDFLAMEEKQSLKMEKSQELFIKYEENILEVSRLKKYLKTIRKEEERIVIELYRLNTAING